MKVKDMKSIIQDLDDEVDIEVNSVWDEEKKELTPSSCEAFYHEKVFLHRLRGASFILNFLICLYYFW